MGLFFIAIKILDRSIYNKKVYHTHNKGIIYKI